MTIFLILVTAAARAEIRAVAKTTSGVLEGSVAGRTMIFLGVPYAEPPVGNLRWRTPVPFRASGVRSATQPADACVQPESADAATGAPSGPVRGSEDCLYLNVWAPRTGSGKAVMVFIHGGGFTSGSSLSTSLKSGSLALYDGHDLSEKNDVIVVSIEYRLGALGFLAHPALGREAGGLSGNYGLYDQIEALKWVQQNIAAFGGNPQNVTIFGESAGGMSTCTLIASPRAAGLFRSAILESFNCPTKTIAQLETRGVALGRALGCPSTTDSTCLRHLPPAALVASVNQYVAGSSLRNDLTYNPAVDGVLLTEPSLAAIGGGRGLPVNVLAGHNSGEFPVQSLSDAQKRWSAADFNAQLTAVYGAQLGNAIFALYNPAAYPSVADAVADFKIDEQFTCSAETLLRATAQTGRPAYGYTFNQAPLTYLQRIVHGLSSLGEGDGTPLLKPFHGAELIYVFQKVEEVYSSLALPGDQALSAPRFGADSRVESLVGNYWTNFAKTGNPNGALLPNWPAYNDGARTLMVLQTNPAPSSNTYRAKCDAITLGDAYLENANTPVGKFINGVYRDLLARSPAPAEVAFWIGVYQTQGRAAVARAILNSQERRDLLVNSDFVTYLKRAGGTNNPWSNGFGGPSDRFNVAAGIAGSAESLATNGGCAGLVTTLYRNALGRAPDAGGLSAWTNYCAGAGPTATARGVFFSAEAAQGQVLRWYRELLGREADPAGLASFQNRLLAGTPIADLLVGFVASDEYFARCSR